MQHTVRQELHGILAFLGIIWIVFLLEWILPLRLLSYGVTPRTLSGLAGIPAMPFLHASLQHILSNSLPLLVLLTLLAGSRANSWAVVAAITVLGGGLLWLVGRPATHVGASGLIFGLMAFLIVSGWVERRFVPLAVSILVTILYGGSLLWGILPSVGGHISWEGHLCGALAGAAIAGTMTRRPAPRAVAGTALQ